MLNGKRQKKGNCHSRFDIGFLKTNENKLRSGATSLFDVQRWTFDVRCSSFKTTLHSVNVTNEYLHKNLALLGLHPNWKNEKSSLRDQ
jgi:hypothetical protein